MKKKILALMLALALALSACGGGSEPPAGGGEQNVTTPDSGAAPEEETPDAAPAEIDLSEFYNTLREENTWPELMNLMEDETITELLDSYYAGLSEIPTKQCGVYIAAISAAVGEIALVEVENAGDVQAVKDIFQARIDYQVGDDANPGGAWYPETIEGWRTKSHIVSHGNYVMLAVGDAAEAAVESFEAAVRVKEKSPFRGAFFHSPPLRSGSLGRLTKCGGLGKIGVGRTLLHKGGWPTVCTLAPSLGSP